MLDKEMVDRILELKDQGYTQSGIIEHFKQLGEKPPSRPTLGKYFHMEKGDGPGPMRARSLAFDKEPYKSTIINILESNDPKELCISSMYDVLCEKFSDNNPNPNDEDEEGKLPGNEQTLRNYVKYLKESGQIQIPEKTKRIYTHIGDIPAGNQMIVDFGVEGNIHFMCMLLYYSRYLLVYAQDHKFTSEEACRTLYKGFKRLGGRPKQLVIDQDSVFVASEKYGEVTKTATFEQFCSEQELSLWVCRKADPESKGSVENVVKFVKMNFFSARNVTCLDDVDNALPGWLNRKNNRIHRATLQIPSVVFEQVEKASLQPLLPSFFDSVSSSFNEYEVKSQPYVLYRTNYYSVPYEYAYHTVKYKVTKDKLYVYSMESKLICTHVLSELKGQYIMLEEHKKESSKRWDNLVARVRLKWYCPDLNHFINGIAKENQRYKYEQLLQVEKFLDKNQPSLDFVAELMQECCNKFRYKFSQFEAVYKSMGGPYVEDKKTTTTGLNVEHQNLNAYSEAFQQRAANLSEATRKEN